MLGKRRFALFLPILLVLLSAVMTEWGESIQLRFGLLNSHVGSLRYLCEALNAPALLFRYAERFISPLSQGLAFLIDTLLDLLGVALLWYYVGRQFDTLRSDATPCRWRIPVLGIPFYLFVVLWGLKLFSLGDALLHVRFTKLSLSREYYEWCHHRDLVGDFNRIWGYEDCRLRADQDREFDWKHRESGGLSLMMAVSATVPQH